MTQARIDALTARAEREGMHCVAVLPGPNMTYLTGLEFHLSERPTVAFFPSDGRPHLVLPELEHSKGEDAPFDVELHSYDDVNGPEQAFAAARGALRLDNAVVGVEGRRMRYLEIQLLGEAGLVNADTVFAAQRMRKDADELAAMREAVAIAERALVAVASQVQPGARECDLVNELVVALLRNGSGTELPFHPIVATGVQGALPHAVPGETPLAEGDLLIIDWGASHRGYFSDITRTFAVGSPEIPEKLHAAYEAVREANAAGRAAARPGVAAEEVDRAARAVITDAGFGEYFVHRTGHGLGLECHEEPDIKEGSTVLLEPGMTFTVEPGVYLPGLGGVRIEDDVVVTEGGCESLTTLDRELTVLG